MNKIISLQANIIKIATGFVFLEGPVWNAQHQKLIFSDIRGDCMYQWSSEKGTEVYRKPSHKANGNAYDPNGCLITCEHATSRIVRENPDGELDILAEKYEGKELNSPNDVIVSHAGVIYFTDPALGRGAKYGLERAQELDFQGVFRIDPKTKATVLLDGDFEVPNGLCFSLDEKHLFVNDTPKMLVKVYDVLPNGDLQNGREWVLVAGAGEGKPDGMKIDSQGNLYTCGPGGIHVFDPNANFLGVIPVPEKTANFNWGGADLCDLFITAQTSLYQVHTLIPGNPSF
jgi:gluconolactonase